LIEDIGNTLSEGMKKMMYYLIKDW